jgi:hypothetical protein
MVTARGWGALTPIHLRVRAREEVVGLPLRDVTDFEMPTGPCMGVDALHFEADDRVVIRSLVLS